MKTKRHISPFQTLGSIFLLGGWSSLYLLNSLTYGTDKLDTWLFTVITVVVLGMMIASLIFNVLTIRNKNLRKGDEFTTKIIRKSAYITFEVIISLIAILFVVLQIVMLINKDASESSAGGINDLLDVRYILASVAFIQITSTFLFALLFFIFSKKGDMNAV